MISGGEIYTKPTTLTIIYYLFKSVDYRSYTIKRD